MKFLHDCGSLDCLHVPGQAIRTVLCFMPPRPADWMRWDMPSLRFDDTTTWQKPFVRSADMEDLMFWTGGETRQVILNNKNEQSAVSTNSKWQILNKAY